MKLFITNKSEFESDFKTESCAILKTTYMLHKELFNIIQQNLIIDNKIDIFTYLPYKKNEYEGDVIFEFLGKNKDIFFFKYNGTIY